ncbi:pathogenicity island protein [Staphylococcus rostri]
MKQQVIITRSIVGWLNIRDTKGNLLLNVAPDVFRDHFRDVSENVTMACMELDLSRLKSIKNKKKVGS